MTLLVSTYFMKFATDVLAIPAATMGGILLASRAWDAVADPVAGYLSDRTRTRFGRRRPVADRGRAAARARLRAGVEPAGALLSRAGLALVDRRRHAAALHQPHDLPHAARGARRRALARLPRAQPRVRREARARSAWARSRSSAALSLLGEASEPRAMRAPARGRRRRRHRVLLLFTTGIAVREPAAHLGRGAARPLRRRAGRARATRTRGACSRSPSSSRWRPAR